MKSLLISPVGSSAKLQALTISQSIAQFVSLRMCVDESGQLAIQHDRDGEQDVTKTTIPAAKTAESTEICESDIGPMDGMRPVGDLFYQSNQSSWFLAFLDPNCGVNHQTPPLELAKLEPGSLLSVKEQFWHVASMTTAEPFEAPADLANKSCPVCGDPLGAALIVQCECGRYSHLEKPDAPDDPDALNCYLLAKFCGGCHQRTSLEPQISPALPLCLADWASDEDLELQLGQI